ncbi:hypothetical protein [Sphingomonas sp. Marseille-Q8236]
MVLMERIIAPIRDGELTVVRLLRYYCAVRDRNGDGMNLSRLVMFGQSLTLLPAGSIALASVFQLAEAVLKRKLVTESCSSRCLSCDERAVIRLLSSPGKASFCNCDTEAPHGLHGALHCAVLSVRQLCGEVVTATSHATRVDGDKLPFATPALA